MRKCYASSVLFIREVMLIVFIIIGLTSSSQAQLTGAKAIPGAYATLAAAIADLNTQGVGTGGVTFNIAAGYTETFGSPTAGIISATGTAANPILFQKSGTGSNPVISAGVGTGTLDGIIVITGGSYITFDGINLLDPNTASALTEMEWGYALLKKNAAAPFVGCQYVTIKNCTITMNNLNTSSYGIFCNNQTAASATALTITATSDAMNNCKFFNNTITNSYYGIYLLGYNATSPFTLYDQNNEIGKDGANTITNWGGGTVAAYGIYAAYQNNIKVDNNSVTSASGGTSTVYGICLGTSTSSNAEIIGNTVTVSCSATTTSLAGIYNSAGGTTLTFDNTVTIANNTIQNCTWTTATTGSFYGIVGATSPSHINIYGNNVINNSKAGTTGTFYSILSVGGTTTNCYSNTIHDNSITAATATGALYGLFIQGAQLSETYHDNTIYNLTNSGTGALYGMNISSTTGAKTSYNNIIHTLSTTSGPLFGYISAYGIPHNFYKNQIYDLTATAAAGLVFGVSLAPTTLNMYNNYIYNLKAPAATSTNAINGIYLTGGTVANIYFNTVYINATSSSASTFGTTGIYASTTPIVDMRNNVIVNTSTPVGAAYTVAYRRSSTTLTSYSALSNSNDFYAGTPGANNLIFNDGTNSDQTIAAFKTRANNRDAVSFTELPNFTTIAGNTSRINTTIATQLESGGVKVASPISITDDYFGNVRNTTTPDVGAEEFAGILSDLNPPAISYTALPNTYTTSVLTATITDPSGVATSGSGRPTLYWKLNAGSYTAVTGVSIGNNQFTFTFGGSGSPGDVISYYIAAQDNAGTPNVGTYPSAGASGYSVNPPAASTPPTTPSTYTVTASALAGDYTVGATLFKKITGKNIYFEKQITKVIVQEPVLGFKQETALQKKAGKYSTLLDKDANDNLVDNGTGVSIPKEVEQITWIPMENGKKYDGPLYVKKSENPEYNYPEKVEGVYATITAAVADLNLRGVSAPTRFLLNDASYSTGETFPITIAINNANLPTATNTVTIKPSPSVTPTITGLATSTALFKLNGSDYITIDGSNSVGGTTRDMTLTSLTPSTTTACIVWVGSASTTDGATYNTIKNCNFVGTGSTTPTVIGLFIGNGTTLGSAGDASNSNNTIQNNSFIALQNGLYHSGFPYSPFDQNLTITGNSFGSATAANYLIFRGMLLQNAQNFNISGNTISGVVSTSASTSTMVGIQIGSNMVGGTINGNIINNINQTNTAGTYSAAGIYVGASTFNSNITISNNMIYNIVAYGNGYINGYNGYGIWLVSGGGYKVYYNSVRLSTNQTSTSSIPACLLVYNYVNTPGSVDVRDNIFYIDETTVLYGISITIMVPLTTFTNLNYNDYYSTSYLGYLGGYVYGDVPSWQSATGQDANSVSQNPVFNSLTDLHLNTSTVPYFLMGTPISGITKDIDGDTRNATYPYMGADEVPASPLPVELSTFTVSSKNGSSILNWETKTEHNSSEFIVERSVFAKNNWTEIGDVKARGNSNIPTKYSFTDSKLNAGKFAYRLKMVDVDGGFAYSSTINSVVELPQTFVLSQNYPNPFNPSTRIDYQLPSDARVTIELFSITGQKVAELVNNDQAAGYYSLEVGSSSLHKELATGVYIYRMTATGTVKGNNFTSTKKMLLLK